MVYCGKPSRACHACRAKKTRCDAKPEGCTPCARTGRQCPGYRKQVDLMFRDQSSNVIRKAKAAEAKRSGAISQSPASSRETTPESESKSKPAEDFELISRHWDPIFSIGPTLDERATCYFVFHYLVGIQAPSRGVLDNLLLLYQTNSIDRNLLTAVKAVSYASYAHHTQSTELTDVSTYQYAKAVTLTNAALRSNDDAAKDSTLMSVMILSMYEILTGSTQRSLEAWMEHVRGSAALVKLRGEEQLKTPQGRRLFVQASIGILTSCIQLCIPVPRTVEKLIRKIPLYMDLDDDLVHVAFGIHLTMIEVNQFRAAVAKEKITDLHEIVSRLLELDAKFESMLADPPREFRYYVIHAPDSGIAYNGKYHVYFDLLTANLWNSVRVFRILLHEQIREFLLKGFTTNPPTFTKLEHTSQLQRSMDACYEYQEAILYSVPQHLGYVSDTSSDLSARFIWGSGLLDQETVDRFEHITFSNTGHPAAFECSSPSETSDSSPKSASSHQIVQVPGLRASGGYNLMWPLWLAGAMDLVTEETRTYAAKMMRRIGEDMGIRQAFMLAQVIEDRDIVIDVWQNKEKFEIKEED